MDKDPTGVAAAVAVIVMSLAALFNWQIDDGTAGQIGMVAAGIITLGGILAARRKAWAPDTVAALGPDTVGPPGVLPEPPPRKTK